MTQEPQYPLDFNPDSNTFQAFISAFQRFDPEMEVVLKGTGLELRFSNGIEVDCRITVVNECRFNEEHSHQPYLSKIGIGFKMTNNGGQVDFTFPDSETNPQQTFRLESDTQVLTLTKVA